MQVQRVQNNTTFGAKLNVEQLGNVRWNKIAQKFEELTKEYPNDTIKISVSKGFGMYNPDKNGIFNRSLEIFSTINNNGRDYATDGLLTSYGTMRLTGLKDNQIVNKLLKFHKILRTASDMSVEGSKFLNDFTTKFKDSKIGLFHSKLSDAIHEARETSIFASLSKDNVLKALQTTIKHPS